MKSRLTASLVFFLISSLTATAGERRKACLDHYTDYVHQKLYIPGTKTYQAMNDVFDCFKRNGNHDIRIVFLPFMVMIAPFRIASGVYQTMKDPIIYLQNSIRGSKYGTTLELMSLLEELRAETVQELNMKWVSETEIDDLVPALLQGLVAYEVLTHSEVFSAISHSTSADSIDLPDLVRALLREYLFGDLFCGGSNDFKPIPLSTLLKNTPRLPVMNLSPSSL